jgi:hypothetical protein
MYSLLTTAQLLAPLNPIKHGYPCLLFHTDLHTALAYCYNNHSKSQLCKDITLSKVMCQSDTYTENFIKPVICKMSNSYRV